MSDLCHAGPAISGTHLEDRLSFELQSRRTASEQRCR